MATRLDRFTEISLETFTPYVSGPCPTIGIVAQSEGAFCEDSFLLMADLAYGTVTKRRP